MLLISIEYTYIEATYTFETINKNVHFCRIEKLYSMEVYDYKKL